VAIHWPVVLWMAGAVSGAAAATDDSVTATGGDAGTPQSALCRNAPEGYLRMRLQGAIDADLDWSAADQQCLGALRPGGNGIRLIYKGSTEAGEPLLVVIGAGPLAEGEQARHVAANMTIVLEDGGPFYSTRGDDKCALDEVSQEAVPPRAHRYRVSARGYCTQPARAIAGDGSVFVSRFDLVALVDYGPEKPAAEGSLK
jgi:hypothetical protein